MILYLVGLVAVAPDLLVEQEEEEEEEQGRRRVYKRVKW